MTSSEDGLTQAEKRCLRLSYERNKTMPQFPESICASFRVSRPSTLESLQSKGFLSWSPHRGSTYYFTEKARVFVGHATT